MRLDEQAYEVAREANRLTNYHDEEYTPTIDQAMELIRKLAEIVVVLATRYVVDESSEKP